MDSVKAAYGQVLLVDNGGFFPELENHEDMAWFLMDAMKLLGTDAVGMSEKELRYGRAFLLANVKRTQLPITCANLYDKGGKKPLLAPHLMRKVGGVNVGVFAVMSDKVDLGVSRDSLTVEEPAAAARRSIAELRKRGAQVVVMLSQLGKVESEDLVTAVDGVDVLIVGRNVPLMQQGRMIKNTVACYGGEQGQYLGRTIATLDARKRMATGVNETFMLGPEVGEKPEVLTLTKSFEDNFNDKLRKIEKEKAVANQQTQSALTGEAAVDHFVGGEICQRCHVQEYQQWQTTAHARAWQTMVDNKVDSRADCVVCHVVGYKQAGGFQNLNDAAKLGNVQCESCHGMGTQHESYPAQAQRVTEATCTQCHNSSTSPTFNFAIYQPHVVHRTPANLPPLPVNPNKKKMMTGGHSGQ